MANAILSFKLGPVQPFIEAARTLRDLWSGSYLLSWLTAHGMKPLFEKCGYDAFITPHVTKENPLIRAVMSGATGDDAATLACLPHTFAAVIPDGVDAGELRTKCVAECRAEWTRIADAVRQVLCQQADGRMKPFLDSPTWERQIETYFEITCVVRVNQGTSPETEAWVKNEWDKQAELLETTRSVRHVPAYTPTPDEKGRYPVKCSQLGSLEQMGPADFHLAREYWAGLTRTGNKAGESWDGLHGTAIQSSDKLCAVALVKRFMWPFCFAKTDPPLVGRLGVPVRELRFTDTATMAARKWLGEGAVKLDPKVEWNVSRHWSGQWLHWTEPGQDDDAICPHKGDDSLWDRIQARKRESKPPTYFALMHLDGDNMGDLFSGDSGPKSWGEGMARYHKITELVSTFANGMREIVTRHHGELIYAGGDDVLLFLPTDEAIACAAAIRARFRQAMEVDSWREGTAPSLSGGIAVVHYKEDLRFALAQVRAAEKAAKRIGKAHGDKDTKDALALTICKRSGEHSTVVMGWDEAAKLQQLVGEFAGKASDRWAYKLRAELETLKGLPLEAGRAETLRLVGRGENVTKEFKTVIGDLFDAYQKQMQKDARNWPDADVLTGFVTLCQSASFLARGKE